jgi:hypothetical protein
MTVANVLPFFVDLYVGNMVVKLRFFYLIDF